MKILLYSALLSLALAVFALTSCIDHGALDGATAPNGSVQLDDDTIDDWESVTNPDFILYGSTGKDYGKFAYDANYIYFMFVLSEQDQFSPNEHIWNLRLDADNNAETGMSTKGLGCEWYYEGNCCCEDPWNDWYSGSSGDTVYAEMPMETGAHGTLDDGRFYFEVGLNRQIFGIDQNEIAIYTKFYDVDWDDFVYFQNKDGQTTIHLTLDKEQESRGD